MLPDIDAQWDYQDPTGSERRFRELLPLAEEAGDAGFRCELLTQVARAVCLQRDYPTALALVDEAETLLAEGMDRPAVRCLLERGRILNDVGKPKDARSLFEQAWEIARRAGEQGLAADALHMIAYVTEGEESLAWHETAIAYCRECEGPRFERWRCTLHTNVADTHEALGDYPRAIVHVREALAIAERLEWNARVVGSLCFLARLHRLAGDVDRARQFLAEMTAQAGDEPLRGYAHEELGECLLLEGDTAAAREQFRRAYDLLSRDPWYPPGETERLQRIQRLAESD